MSNAIDLVTTRRDIEGETHAVVYDDGIAQYSQLAELVRDYEVSVPEIHRHAEFRQAMMLDTVRSECEGLNAL